MFHFQQEAHAGGVRVSGNSERQEQPPSGSEIVKPRSSQVRRARVDKDRISRLRVVLSAICLQHLNLIQVSETVARTRGKVWIYLDASDMTSWSNHFGDNCRVVTDAAPNMKSAISFFEFERVKPRSEGARMP